MLRDMFHMSSQQRALYCYVGLSIWIFLLIAATYRYIGTEKDVEHRSYSSMNRINREFPRNLKRDVKNKKIFTICNHPDDISSGSEGFLSRSRWSLQGVMTFIRHGDRGPLAHVRNISAINCGLVNSPTTQYLLNQYKTFIQNATSSGHAPWSQSGAFHGFPSLPATDTQCQLAQLTYVGVAQLLTTGRLLRDAYLHRLDLDNLTAEDIVVFSTKYRRTFQSALSFMYGLLTSELFSKLNFIESQSLSFCFTDCSCPAADHYKKLVKAETDEHLRAHPAVAELVHTAANLVYELPDKSLIKDPHVLRDALLTYVCHNAPLPCAGPEGSAPCVRADQVTSLFAYTDWETRQYARSIHLKRSCMLKAYGLIRHVVSQMLRIISEGRPKFILYSGHDWTLQYLSTALGIKNDNAMMQYASKLVIEIYKDNEAIRSKTGSGIEQYFFRLVANGKDVTRYVDFCYGKSLLKINIGESVCRIEAIVRFAHDDYFTALNVTNFKDACRISN